MSKLCEHRTGVYVSKLGEVGIEIETESPVPYTSDSLKYWSAHGDGSLRNYGVEFVLRTPLDVDSKKYIEALNEFDTFSKKQKFLESVYTSVHVHLNFVDKDVKCIANFIVLYVILENVLTRYCGPDRDGNLFCLKTADAETSVELYRNLIERLGTGLTSVSKKFLGSLNANTNKYSGLNVVPLRTLGSIEVRTHPGTTDVEVIDRWVHILHRLYTLAEKYPDPTEILRDIYKAKSYSSFVKDILGEYYRFFSEENIDNDVHATLFYAKTLVYNIKDWSTYGLIKEDQKFMEVKVAYKVFADAGEDPFSLEAADNITTYEATGDL